MMPYQLPSENFHKAFKKNQLAPIRADASSEFSDNMREIFLLAFLIPLKCRRAQCFKESSKISMASPELRNSAKLVLHKKIGSEIGIAY